MAKVRQMAMMYVGELQVRKPGQHMAIMKGYICIEAQQRD